MDISHHLLLAAIPSDSTCTAHAAVKGERLKLNMAGCPCASHKGEGLFDNPPSGAIPRESNTSFTVRLQSNLAD